jgi:YggT family protein
VGSGLPDACPGVNLRRSVPRLRTDRPALTSVGAKQPEDPMQSLYQAIMLVLNVVWVVMIAHIILSWLVSFQVLNLRQPMVAQIWQGLNQMLEPFYAPIRRLLPQTAGLDFAPLVAFVILLIVQQTLANNAGWFYSF